MHRLSPSDWVYRRVDGDPGVRQGKLCHVFPLLQRGVCVIREFRKGIDTTAKNSDCLFITNPPSLSCLSDWKFGILDNLGFCHSSMFCTIFSSSCSGYFGTSLCRTLITSVTGAHSSSNSGEIRTILMFTFYTSMCST